MTWVEAEDQLALSVRCTISNVRTLCIMQAVCALGILRADVQILEPFY
jgi:hypothetical protein